MHKSDFALNNLYWLICHKTKPNYIIIPIRWEYLICAKNVNISAKNVNISIQCMHFPNLLAKNNARQFDMPLKYIRH